MATSKTVPATRVGCCGWPEGKSKYFEHFPVVELQSTFYEPPSLALAEKWRALAPDDFHFCMKAWQLITHVPASPTYRRLKTKLSENEYDSIGWFRPTEQVSLAWEKTWAVARVLRAKVILFQCPPSFLPSKENVLNFRSFMSGLERGRPMLAWEPRGEWPDELIEELCTEFNLVHCVDPFTRRQVSGPGYWRLHGFGGYRYRYTEADLDRLVLLRQDYRPLYIMFNNVWMKEDAMRFSTRNPDLPASAQKQE